MLTNERLKEINKNLEEHLSLFSEHEMERDQKTYCTFRPSELHNMKEAVDELLAIREAGDEEVQKLFAQIWGALVPAVAMQAEKLRDIAISRGQQLQEAETENTRLEQDISRLKVEFDDLGNRFDATNKACDIFEKNNKAAADLFDENRKLKAEIENLRRIPDECEVRDLELVVEDAEMTDDQRAAFQEIVRIANCARYNVSEANAEADDNYAMLESEEDRNEELENENQSLKSQIATLTAERDEAIRESKCSHEVAMLAGNEAIDSAGEVYLLKQELAALKSAPGMTDLNGLESAWRDSGNPVAYVEMIIDIARRSIAAREEVVGLLKHILSCIITVKQENTPEWMEYIAEEVNKINEAIGDPGRVSLRFGGIVIVKGGPEIVEGKMPNEILKELEVNLENARGGQNTGDIEAAIIAIEEYKRKKLVDGLLAVESLILESSGVAGLHRNGDLASWDELRTGGRFEEWLYQLDDALEIARSDHADRRERRGEEGN